MSEYSSSTKKDLQEASDKYKEDILEGLKVVGDSLGQKGKNALIISGSLVAAYMVYKAIAGSDKNCSKPKRKRRDEESNSSEELILYGEQEPSVFEKMSSRIMEQALIFLLTIAKDQLLQFLEKQFNHPDDIEQNK